MGIKGNRQNKIKMAKPVIIFVVILILALLLETQITWILTRNGAEKSTGLLLNQIETVLSNNEEEEKERTAELKENYISYARSVAYILDAKPEAVRDVDALKEIAQLQLIDEIHIFDETGTIIAGTVPEYYGYSFDSGEQMGYFKPMLEDKSLAMCQDITPNTAEGKNMMYAIVWNREGTYMIQVGIEPKRLLAELKKNDISNVIRSITITEGFDIYVIDTETGRIAATTNKNDISNVTMSSYVGAIGSEKSHTGSGIVHRKGNAYFCSYRPVNDYIVAVAYTMGNSRDNMVIPLIVIAIYLSAAGIGILMLISKLYRAEEKQNILNGHLEKSNKELEQTVSRLAENQEIVRAAGFGIWKFSLSPEGRICGMSGNDKLMDIYGYDKERPTPEELLKYFLKGIENEEDDLTKYDYSVQEIGKIARSTYAWRHPRKGTIYIESSGIKFVDSDGNAMLFGSSADVTETVLEGKRQKEELQAAKNQAEAANAAKTSFLFNMSHDIRTPMNAIMGFRDLLEKHQEDPEKRQDYLNKIQDASTVLLSIINNVLEMARIEKGTLEIDETAWSTEQFNDTLYSVFHVMMAEKGLNFTRQIEVQHRYVYCDPTKLREIFINILSNAYKYTNAGGSVNMHLEEVPSCREGWVLYKTTISDTGIGMSEEFLPHIFEEFSRENNTTDAKVEGTGLGMPIVKRLVEMLDGTIEVKSKKGEGSTFTVTIPHRIADKANLVDHAGVEIDPKLFKDKHILLAEDNDLNAEIAMEILDEAGFKVDRAENGAICVDMLEKAEAGHYDLILMDIQMPNMNGYEATRTIRQLEDHEKANIKILAMTANAFEEDKREAFRAGMNGHLAKPINVKDLMRTLAGIIG